MKSHEVHVFENGSASIRNITLNSGRGETMHSSLGADAEARCVYIAQSGLATKLKLPISANLVLYDLGMGIATNALAALELAQKTQNPRPLQIMSFEKDLEGLEMALSKPQLFPTQARNVEILRSLMSDHSWRSPDGRLSWELHLGSFESTPLGLLQEAAPEVIFYDFYSPGSTPELWTYELFQKLYDATTATQRDPRLSSFLTTYSAATSVRSAMLLAGFYVGKGSSTELKSETTVASTRATDLSQPLGQDWLDHLARSSKALPTDIAIKSGTEISAAYALIRGHKQFEKRA